MKKINLFIIPIIFITILSAQQSTSISAAIKTAKLLERKGDIDGAISIHKGILKKNPKNFSSVQQIKSLYLNYEKYNEGIVVLSAYTEGVIGKLLLESSKDAAMNAARKLQKLFGDRFYFDYH